MKKGFICYFDMDGVLNLFEADPNARYNMWTPGYYCNIPVRPHISNLLERINQESYVILLSKLINRIGVTKEKNIWLAKHISPNAYSDVLYVPYEKSKADFLLPYYPSMLVDDNETNLAECEKKGCRGLFFSDNKISKKYPNAKDSEGIWEFYQNLIKSL